jgi:hypothetical protein
MCASGIRPTGWTRLRMSPSGRGPPWIARSSSRWLGCYAGSRSPRRVTGSGSEAGVPFNRKRGALSSRGDHAALRTRWPSGRLKPMDNTALLAPGIRAPSRARASRRMSRNSHGLSPRNMPEASAREAVTRQGPELPLNHGDHAHRDVRYGLADDGEHVEEGLTFRAEGQLIPVSGTRRLPGRLLFGRGHGLRADWMCRRTSEVLTGSPGSSAAGTGRRRGRRSHRG